MSEAASGVLMEGIKGLRRPPAYLIVAERVTGSVSTAFIDRGNGSSSISGGRCDGDGSLSCIGKTLDINSASTFGKMLSRCTRVDMHSSMTMSDSGSMPSALNLDLKVFSVGGGLRDSKPS